jgi:hypothetical protein
MTKSLVLLLLLGLSIHFIVPVGVFADETKEDIQSEPVPGQVAVQDARGDSERLLEPETGVRPLPPIRNATLAPLVLESFYWAIGFPTITEKWIHVKLSEQRAVAYEGKLPVRIFTISSGRPRTPTVTGTFRIWIKTPLQDMQGGNRAAGDYYYLKDVPWVQYFYKDYSFHGTYWHNNFGQPMSRGCINMTIEDAKWLFYWTTPSVNSEVRTGYWIKSTPQDPGTLVVIEQ